MKRIETSKGEFVVLDESELDFKYKKGITYVYNNRHLIDWYNRVKLSEITEEEAKEIVGGDLFDSHLLIPMDCYRHKLKSLLKLIGIEITNNTYIFKV